MSRKTLTAVDQLCRVANLTALLESALPDEVASWHEKWKQARTALQQTVQSLGDKDWQFLERRAPGECRELKSFRR